MASEPHQSPEGYRPLRLADHSEQPAITSTTTPYSLNCPLLLGGVALIALILLASLPSHVPSHNIRFASSERSVRPRLPRVFWIYTENEVDAEPMEADIFVHHYAHIAQQNNYEVRYVNSWNAYDWLSNVTAARITKTMQNSRIDETVHSLLKLALLHQNGGILASPGTFFQSPDLAWLQEMFSDAEGAPAPSCGCVPASSFLYLPQANRSGFSAGLVAAVPGSQVLSNSFDLLSSVILNETLPKGEEELLLWNDYLRVSFLPSSFETIINLAIRQGRAGEQIPGQWQCQLGLQFLRQHAVLFLEGQTGLRQLTSKWGIEKSLLRLGRSSRNQTKVLIGLEQPLLKDYLGWLITGQVSPQQVEKGSVLRRILEVEPNRRVFLEPLPQRQVTLCLVFMDPLPPTDILATRDALSRQTFRNWTVVLSSTHHSQLDYFGDGRFLVMAPASNKVHTVERALTRHCPVRSHAVLLNRGETFTSDSALETLGVSLRERGVAGVLVSLQVQGCVRVPKKRWTVFDREHNGIVNPRLSQMTNILNHLRVVSVQTFRQIPQFTLRNLEGAYFPDRIIFLMDLLEVTAEPPNSPPQLFLIKKNLDLWQFPLKVELQPQVTIRTPLTESLDQEQLRTTRTRIPSIAGFEQLESILKYKVPFSKLVALNPGADFLPVDQKKGPQRIPRIIHQVWLGSSELPPAKRYLFNKAQRLYPDFQMKLWGEQNLTRQAFPTTYDLIRTLVDFNNGKGRRGGRRSPFNKLATVTDIMRHEILLREGGFWKDAGMDFLRPLFGRLLQYRLVLPVDRNFKFRYLQGMCIFGNEAGFSNMERINNPRNLNRMRIYSNDAMAIAGPVDFRQLLSGEEEFDPEFLLMPYETFYPGQLNQHPEGDLCIKHQDQLAEGEPIEFNEGGWCLLTHCEDLYPYSFGIEHNSYGSTWQKRRSD